MRIDTKSGRDSLPERREPYWTKAGDRGEYLGVRIGSGGAYWVARCRARDGQHYHPIGQVTEALDYGAALEAARAWFPTIARGVRDHRATVWQACTAYVEHLRPTRPNAARDAESRFEREVKGRSIATVTLKKLTDDHVRMWRDAMKLKPAASNRTLAALKAALNRAVLDKKARPALSQELRLIPALRHSDKRRTLYLDRKQRAALVAACKGAAGDLVRAAALTGCRAGELTSATVGAFDARTGMLTVSGKTGTRTIPLAPPAVTLFKHLAKGRAPDARLLTRDDGKPWAHSDWDELVKAAATEAKLPAGVVLYTLRHSFITQLLLDGAPTLEVARIVGTSVAMIEKHYGHLVHSAARSRLAKAKLL